MRKIILIAAAVLIVAGLVAYAFNARSSHKVVLDSGARVSDAATSRVSLDQVDHSVWDQLLKKYVDDNGMVDYASWKATEADTTALKQYLETLGQGDPEAPTTKPGKLAFWINAYNALTVYGILQVYPTTSIRNHTSKLLGYNIWRDLLLTVGDKEHSLEGMEHEILRKQSEPRIHFTIVCASIGCPRLRNEAYTGEQLEVQLADNTRDFFSRPRNFQIDPEGRRVRVSSILDWFGEDFGPTPQKALGRLAEYFPNDMARQRIEQGDFTVEYLDYNWNLNAQ